MRPRRSLLFFLVSTNRTEEGTTFVPILQQQVLRAVEEVEGALQLSASRKTPVSVFFLKQKKKEERGRNKNKQEKKKEARGSNKNKG